MFKDNASGQIFAQAFDAVATPLRTGGTPADQPWFENQLPGLGALCGGGSSTSCIALLQRANFQNGNISSLFLTMDFLRAFALGLDPFNNLQVFDLFLRTHRDISNYHALVATLRNRGWHGLLFDFNYTFSKSLDQVGAVQNSASYYATSFNRHVEYGPSFFDRTHVINLIYNYELPFGRGHRLGSSHEAVNKFIGGWYLAGVYRFGTGLPLLAFKTNQAFGGGSIFGFPNGLIPLQDPASFNTGVHSGVRGSNGVGTSGDPANNGTALNLFSDPEAASKQFRDILLSSDTSSGRGRPLRGLNFWSWDARIGKETRVTEKVKVEFSFDFFNVLNHPIFNDPSMDLTNPAAFGVITTELTPANRNAGSRWIQFGLRLNF
jgi:hypothetical protein